MSVPPLVSVVIPAYNAAGHIRECLASVEHESADIPHETIVVDDGSTDDTVAIVGTHDDATCITQRNSGPSAARNRGIAAAQGEFIAFLDADDLWPVGKLEAQLRILFDSPTAALVFGDCRQFTANGPYPQTEFQSNRLGESSWGPGHIVPDAYERLLDVNFITTGSVIVRRSALTEVGGFAEDLRLVEDLELWLRIARHHPIAWSGATCLLRRRHDSNISRDSEAMALAYLEVLRRHAEGWDKDGTSAQPDQERLAARKLLYMAELAATRGQLGTALRRAWSSLRARPRPETLWQLAKTAARVTLKRHG